jgi:hypothetical protein
MSLAVVFLLIVFAVAIWRPILNQWFARTYGSRLPLLARQEWRLCCIGVAHELAEYGEWADVSFQPALFFGQFVIGSRGWSVSFRGGITLLGFLVMIGLNLLATGDWVNPGLYIEMLVVIVGAEAAIAFLWPTYLRLVPGRLDVLGYSPLSRKPVFVDKYDLRDAKITADLRRSFVSIASPRGSLEFGISLMRERKRFVYMLFLAAMSTFQPAPLPEDELVG